MATAPVEGQAPTAASAHDMVVAVGIMSAFVYAMVIFAGTSRNAGRTIAALFVALLILQGLGRVNPFGWLAEHPLTKTPAAPVAPLTASETATVQANAPTLQTINAF